jgi:GntR family transcriptional regulator, transcriptional repressor for pyruvate dehydrogenase complex
MAPDGSLPIGCDAPTSSHSLVMRVTDYICNRIRDSRLPTGEELPSELQVSIDLKVSRGVVREGFCSLELAGIIEKAKGRRPRVGALNGRFLTHLMVHALSTRQITLEQILELRTSIEVKAAELAARRRTDDEAIRLWIAAEGMNRSVHQPNIFVRHDLEFHQIIGAASGNPLIQVVCTALHETIEESIRAGLRKLRAKEEIARVVKFHERIADAIESADPNRAEAAMRSHFDESLTTPGSDQRRPIPSMLPAPDE